MVRIVKGHSNGKIMKVLTVNEEVRFCSNKFKLNTFRIEQRYGT